MTFKINIKKIHGGMPAIENKTRENRIANAGFDFFNKIKSLSSLLFLAVLFFFNCNNNKIYQNIKLESIYIIIYNKKICMLKKLFVLNAIKAYPI